MAEKLVVIGLPSGWVSTTVADFCEVVGGGTPSTDESTHWDGTIPWITSADIYGVKDIRPRRQINEGAIKASATSLVPSGSIVVVTRVGLGKVALTEEPLCFSQDSQGLVFNTSYVNGLYFTYFLSESVQKFKYESRGTTINGVTKKQLRDLPVLLPPLAEQHRIVAEIEKQFTRLDASVAVLRRAQANLKRYRASVLKDACEGRLVPSEADLARSEGREYEPASVLLERILAERRARWESQEKRRVKYKEPSAPDTSALPELPEGWVWATVEHLVVEPLANGRSVKTVAEGFPVLRLTALREGEIDETEHKIGKWTAQQAEPFLIEKGDFFVSRGSGSIRLVGIGGLVREVESAVAFPDTMIRFRLNEFVLNRYFSLMWNSYVVRAQVEASARTTAGIYKVNQQDLAAMTIPLPPLAEQWRIVAEVERRLSVVQQAEATVEVSLARAERLRQSILNQAFSGRLVPQDPDDEPASALLERIRTEREAEAQASSASMGKSGRGRKRATR